MAGLLARYVCGVIRGSDGVISECVFEILEGVLLAREVPQLCAVRLGIRCVGRQGAADVGLDAASKPSWMPLADCVVGDERSSGWLSDSCCGWHREQVVGGTLGLGDDAEEV